MSSKNHISTTRAFITTRIDSLRHELSHANNAIRTHTQSLQAAQDLKAAALYRIDELEYLQEGLGITANPPAPETPNVPKKETKKTPGS